MVSREILSFNANTGKEVHGFVSSSSEDEGGDGEDASKMLKGFKNLMCPLCLKVMYKCTTASCGHSFCERCLDEYLIIKKVRNISLNHSSSALFCV